MSFQNSPYNLRYKLLFKSLVLTQSKNIDQLFFVFNYSSMQKCFEYCWN